MFLLAQSDNKKTARLLSMLPWRASKMLQEPQRKFQDHSSRPNFGRKIRWCPPFNRREPLFRRKIELFDDRAPQKQNEIY